MTYLFDYYIELKTNLLIKIEYAYTLQFDIRKYCENDILSFLQKSLEIFNMIYFPSNQYQFFGIFEKFSLRF